MIKIEVTGNSIPEVADKLLAIGAKLRSIHIVEMANAAADVRAEVAEVAPVDPTPAPKSAPVAEVTDSPPPTPETSSTPAPAALDFDTDVAPHVLALVTRSGKPAAQEILSQFGVEKASLLDPARWPELVTALQDAG
jgi:hypothetical protein